MGLIRAPTTSYAEAASTWIAGLPREKRAGVHHLPRHRPGLAGTIKPRRRPKGSPFWTELERGTTHFSWAGLEATIYIAPPEAGSNSDNNNRDLDAQETLRSHPDPDPDRRKAKSAAARRLQAAAKVAQWRIGTVAVAAASNQHRRRQKSLKK